MPAPIRHAHEVDRRYFVDALREWLGLSPLYEVPERRARKAARLNERCRERYKRARAQGHSPEVARYVRCRRER